MELWETHLPLPLIQLPSEHGWELWSCLCKVLTHCLKSILHDTQCPLTNTHEHPKEKALKHHLMRVPSRIKVVNIIFLFVLQSQPLKKKKSNPSRVQDDITCFMPPHVPCVLRGESALHDSPQPSFLGGYRSRTLSPSSSTWKFHFLNPTPHFPLRTLLSSEASYHPPTHSYSKTPEVSALPP